MDSEPKRVDIERGALADEILSDVAERFGLTVAIVVCPVGLSRDERSKVQEARLEAWAALRELGYQYQTIAARFGVSKQAVQQGIKRFDDSGEHEQPVRLAFAVRMLPSCGPRLDCENDGDCLAELWRACGRVEPTGASCPAVCPSYAPRSADLYQATRAEPTW